MSPNDVKEAAHRSRRQHTARFRLRVILPAARFRLRQVSGENSVFITARGDELRRVTDVLDYQARIAGIARRTAWRWYQLFLSSGLAGLARRKRSDSGISRSLSRRGLALLFLSDRKAEGRSALAAYRLLTRIWPRLYPQSGVPSYATVRRSFRKVRR